MTEVHISDTPKEGKYNVKVIPTSDNNKTGVITEFNAKKGDDFGVFVFAGYVPETSLVKGIANLNEAGYIITDKSQKTSVDGLYAAGDVCIKPLRQVVTAVSDGAMAATELEKYVQLLQEKTGIYPKRINESDVTEEVKVKSEFFSEEIVLQLQTVFAKMENPLILKLFLNDSPLAYELNEYINELASLTDKLSVTINKGDGEEYPYVAVYKTTDKESGLEFHGVPGGHEFTSFILGLYNASGCGQQIASDVLERIKKIDKNINMKVLVSLSCTMCPELVIATQKIACVNEKVQTHVYDVNHFPGLKEKYNVMSVPCLVINDETITFGKKNINQVLDIITQ